MPPAGNAGRWETYVASAIGADHVRAGTPNQDAAAAEQFELRDSGSLLVFAVADGHGHARHFRSDRGSRFAVAAGVLAARKWASAIPADPAASHAAANQLVSDLVAQWRAAVAADLAADPVDNAQAAALLPGDPPEIPYGSTLLLAVIRADVAVLAQIGDGDIILIRPDGGHLAPVPDDSSLDGTQTTSLCQPNAVSAFRIALVNLATTPVFAILAATDGYGNAQADENWRRGLAADLVGLAMEHGTAWLGQQLRTWAAICASSDGSGDDSTVALSLNTAAVLSPPAGPPPWRLAGYPDDQTRPTATVLAARQAPAESGEQPPEEFARPPAQAGGRRRWLAGAVVAAIALAIFLYLRSSGPSPAQPTFSPAPSPTRSHQTRPAASPSPSHRSSAPSPTPSRKSPSAPSPTPSRKSRSALGPTHSRTSPSSASPAAEKWSPE